MYKTIFFIFINLILLFQNLAISTEVTPTHFITNNDSVPRFAANPTHIAISSGIWSDQNTWNNGVPNIDSIVLIPNGIEVTYTTAGFNAIEIQGILRANTTVDTSILANDIQIHPLGALIIGDANNPVNTDVTAEVIIMDNPNKLSTIDLAAYGQGIANFGKWYMYGDIKTGKARSTTDIVAGSNGIVFSSNINNWKNGDTVVIPDTRPIPSRNGTNWTEVRTISGVSSNAISLNQPLSYNHLGGKNGDYQTDTFPHVGNLTRNIVVVSENPQGNRGHTIEFADCDSKHIGVRFSGLGRTKVGATKANVKNPDGTVTINNQIGRYSSHKHHISGPENIENTGFQFIVSSCVFDDGLKWGLAVHDSHYGNIDNNVFYDIDGAAIATEDGSEYLNEIRNNLVCKVTGGLNPADKGDLGDGIWMKGSRNIVANNVVADCINDCYHYDGVRTADKTVTTPQSVRIPLFRGADTHDNGQVSTINLREMGLLDFSYNEGYGAQTFLETWDIGNKLIYSNPEIVHIKNPTVWNVQNGSTFYNTNASILWSFVKARGNWNQPGPLSRCSAFIRWSRFGDLTIDSSDIQGWECGIYNRDRAAASFGTSIVTVQNSFMKNHINMGVQRYTTLRPQTNIWTNVVWEQTPILPTVKGKRCNVMFDETDATNPYLQTFNFINVNNTNYSLYYGGQAAGLGLTPAQILQAEQKAKDVGAIGFTTEKPLAIY